ncbi:MAG: FAD-binding oxidoreductase [Actinomycetota bacterium]
MVAPGHPDYDRARADWNGFIDRRPEVVARCRSTESVAHAVRVGVERGLPLAGLRSQPPRLLDVRRGDRHRPLPDAGRPGGPRRPDRPRGGCRWSDYDTATTRHGLASTGGVVSTTGVAGLTIGGGIGWLMNEHGLACDNLVGAQVVTAGGQIIETSDPGHADLLWGTAGRRWKLRGRHPLRFPRVADWARNRRSRLLP